MNSLQIDFVNDGGVKVDQRELIAAAEDELLKHGRSHCSVSVAVVDEKTISELAIKYMGEVPDKAKNHPVLSFCEDEVSHEFIVPSANMNYLGEVILNASEPDLGFWVRHGIRHLIGIHHD